MVHKNPIQDLPKSPTKCIRNQLLFVYRHMVSVIIILVSTQVAEFRYVYGKISLAYYKFWIYVQVTSPAGNTVHTMKGTSGDKFEFKAPRSGMYKFCFHNPYSTPETVSFYIHVGHIPNEHDLAKDGLWNSFSICFCLCVLTTITCITCLCLCVCSKSCTALTYGFTFKFKASSTACFLLGLRDILRLISFDYCRTFGPYKCKNCWTERSIGLCYSRAKILESAWCSSSS